MKQIPTIVPDNEIDAALGLKPGGPVPTLPCVLSLTAEDTGGEPFLAEQSGLDGCYHALLYVKGVDKPVSVYRDLARDGERLVWLYTTTPPPKLEGLTVAGVVQSDA